MKKGILFFLLCCSILVSCKHKSSSHHRQPDRLDSLLLIAKDSISKNSVNSKKIISEAESWAKDSSDFYDCKVHLAYYYILNFQLDSANVLLRRYNSFLSRNNKLKGYNSHLMNYYNTRGVYFNYLNEIDSMLYYYNKALFYGKKSDNKEKLPDICINLADVSVKKGNYLDGVKYFREALKISDSLQVAEVVKFPIYLGLGQIYYTGMRNFELSEVYFRKAETFYDSQTPNDKFIFCNNFGNLFYYKQDYKNALHYFNKAKNIVEPIHSDYLANLCYANLSDVFLHLNQLDSAKIYSEKSYRYFKASNVTAILSYIDIIRAGIAMKEGNKPLAGALLKAHDDADFVDPEILTLRFNALEKYAYATGNYKDAYQYLTKKTLLNDSIRSGTVRYSMAEIDLRYKQDTTILRRELLLKNKNEEIHSLRVQYIVWVIISVSVFVMIMFYIILRRRKAELQRIKQIDIIAKIRLQNIRNRISPHFMFNALNRQITSETDKEHTEDILQLSMLLRKSLEMTDKVDVSLSDEIEFVKNYLLIEDKGMGNDFSTVWEMDDAIDLYAWKIPAMFIQIPVENALKHALRPKQGEKKLKIKISEEVTSLSIEITDNGEGYNPERKSLYASTKTGLNVLYQTIDILNKKNKHPMLFQIINLKENGQEGTMASIQIPRDYVF
ncbi:MAG: histidine kinase [Paludibacteraceae bacterium]